LVSRRPANAVLADAGLARVEQAWPTHLASVRRHLFDHIDLANSPRVAAHRDHHMATSGLQSEITGHVPGR
jgi:hypothetical protein